MRAAARSPSAGRCSPKAGCSCRAITEHWPRDVRLDGAPAAVVAIGEVPNLRLPPGSYTISGRFAWSSRPEALPLPDATAIVDLSVDGSRVAQPERPDGGVWLGKRRSAEQPANMEVQVYRLVQDDIPVYLVTRMRLNVAGDAREEMLARVLPEGFTPLSLTGVCPPASSAMAACASRCAPGSHEITLVARGTGVAHELHAAGRERRQMGARGNLELRLQRPRCASRPPKAPTVSIPRRPTCPANGASTRRSAWMRLRSSTCRSAAAVSRMPTTTASRSRATCGWISIIGGFTAVDQLDGIMRRDWRLDMQAPFQLASARQGGEQLLVTAGEKGRAGVELRQPLLNLTTVARKESGSGAMPATGWNGRFDRVVGTLHLPTGHRLLAAIGADGARVVVGAMGLVECVRRALVVVFVYWTAGRIPAAIAALALVLTYQEAPAYIWLWGNLLAALAVARAAPEGRFQKFARAWRTLSFTVLGMALLPFLCHAVPLRAVSAARAARRAVRTWRRARRGSRSRRRKRHSVSRADLADAAAPAAVACRRASTMEAEVITAEEIGVPAADAAAAAANPTALPSRQGHLNSAQVVPRYAAGTVLAGRPGIPAWRYNSYNYFWTGPVETADTVRFIYVGPVVMFFWRIIGAIAVTVLFLWLARLSFGGSLGAARDAARHARQAAARRVIAASHSRQGHAGAGSLGARSPNPGNELLDRAQVAADGRAPCAPHCAEITAANVSVDGERLEVVLQVSALANIAVAMPHASDRWQLDQVSVDARVGGHRAQQRRVAVGADDAWRAQRATLRPARCRRVDATGVSAAAARRRRARAGWTVNGVNESRLVAGSLELARERTPNAAAPRSKPAANSRLRARGASLQSRSRLDDRHRGRAHRAAARGVVGGNPAGKGESVLTPGVEVRNGETALVGLATGESRTRWHSGLARAEELELSVPADASRSEVWSFVVNPQWNVAFEGFAPVLPENVDGPSGCSATCRARVRSSSSR